MIDVIGHIFLFVLLFVFSGLAAVFFIWKYWKSSYLHLFLGYIGAVTFATGLATTLLDFGAQSAILLAAGLTAGLTGFTTGVYVLDLGFAENLFDRGSSGSRVEDSVYSDEELYLEDEEDEEGGGAARGTVDFRE